MFYPANCSGWFCFSSTAVPFCLVIAGYYGAEVPLADSVQRLQPTVNADMLRPIMQFILHQLGLLL